MNIKIPNNQEIYVTYTNSNNEKYIVTSDKFREWYYLYKVINNSKLEKISKKKIPEFEELDS